MSELKIDEVELKNIINSMIRNYIIEQLESLNWLKEVKLDIESYIAKYKMDLLEDKKEISKRMDRLEQSFLDFMYYINHGGVLIQLPLDSKIIPNASNTNNSIECLKETSIFELFDGNKRIINCLKAEKIIIHTCRVKGCENIRAKRSHSQKGYCSTLCVKHKARWKKHKNLDDPKPEIPEGFIMYCNNHGFRTEEQVIIYERKKGKIGTNKWCKECNKDNNLKYKKKDIKRFKEITFKAKIKREYGITYEERQKILESQNNSCAICSKKEMTNTKKLAIDHSHVTSKVRGLLCHQCNLGIGNFSDSIEILKSAIQYLEKNG